MALKSVRSVLTFGLGIALLAFVMPSLVQAKSNPRQSPSVSAHKLVGQIENRQSKGSKAAPAALPTLNTFVSNVVNGQAAEVRGLYVPEIFAAMVVQQPEGTPEFVSPRQNIVTQFRAASALNSVGLLAHNYLAGANFALLQAGQKLYLIYGDGRTAVFVVREVQRYQALQPNSPASDFVDLQSNDQLSAARLFSNAYDRPGQVILQTCIANGGEASWGRLFVIAEQTTE